MTFKKQQLPVVTNWQHWGMGDYTCALEPGTNNTMGQTAAKKEKTLIYLKPGKSMEFGLRFNILTEAKEISDFMKSGG